ncbi:MAG TPA: mycofactocin-coupled SDR family oxidoreductase [Baekduia sp.]|nr:mycofactocin-coupled SDR family oxidoreductase [Baekduia sp.]
MSPRENGAAGRFAGRTVLVSGAGRGQGRAHAIGFAREGADIVGFDRCADIPTAHQPLATGEDLAETVHLVEALDRRMVGVTADVRDPAAVRGVVERAVDEFGRLDVVVANAAIMQGALGPFWEIPDDGWRDVLDVNVTGVWHTAKAAVPAMIEAGNGGAIVVTGSVLGVKGARNLADYVTAKHGLVGLLRVMALELAEHGIRANMVAPTNVRTRMFMNDMVRHLFVPGEDDPSDASFAAAATDMNLLPVPWVEPEDVSAAVRWLASDEARYVTGHILPVDAGHLLT